MLKGSGGEERGLSRLPKGKEYYTFLFSQSTGSDRSVAEVQNLLAMQLKKDTKELAALLEKSPDLSAASLEESFPQAEPAFCLQDLRQRMAEDFPPMPRAFLYSQTSISQSGRIFQSGFLSYTSY